MMQDIKSLTVRVGEIGGPTMKVVGRVAWTLDKLLKAGERGCTPIEAPAPRWSDYVFKLRKAGIMVETVTEKHGGTYAGDHARYVLRSSVEVVEEVRQ
ncbi:winged helix domain-containing protein [Aquabacter cavernae]|uniref:winged helix domain-containing protein n=1 Tax=Aquabacter cavernae TaxID=2496029 RepID=UPI001FE1AB09|nr:hypothetical protein [Aquabacter cavernae]